MATPAERREEARNDNDPNCIGCQLGICTHSHDDPTHPTGETTP